MRPTELSGNIHVWTGTVNKIMVSHENTKTLRSFTTIDKAVNALFLLGDKQAARELNKLK